MAAIQSISMLGLRIACLQPSHLARRRQRDFRPTLHTLHSFCTQRRRPPCCPIDIYSDRIYASSESESQDVDLKIQLEAARWQHHDADDVQCTTAPTPPKSHPSTVRLAVAIAAVMITGVTNRVLYKMALTPLADYTFFLAQLQTFCYVILYFGILWARVRTGKVTKGMLAVPRSLKLRFIAIGFVEAVSSLLSFIAAARLPGVVLPLLGQSIIFWQVLLAYTVLGKRLGRLQLTGVALVVSGVVLAAWPSSASNSLFASLDARYATLFVFATLFPAIDTIIKEKVFKDGKSIAGGKELDLFVVNSFGSLAQAIFVFLLLPALTLARGMTLQDLPGYLSAGWSCFCGITPACSIANCSSAPLLPLLYIITNLAFNVAALNLIRIGGNVVMSLVMSSIVPLTIYAFTLPYFVAAPALGPSFVSGVIVLMMGLGAFNAPLWGPSVRRWLHELRDYRWDKNGAGNGKIA